jgi:hypothetical protein
VESSAILFDNGGLYPNVENIVQNLSYVMGSPLSDKEPYLGSILEIDYIESRLSSIHTWLLGAILMPAHRLY